MQRMREVLSTPMFWLQTAFLVALSATLGSFFLSNALLLLPCELCWWQRVFMFPLPFILGVALLQKRFDVFWYVFPLILVGAAIALYHYIIQMIPAAADTCGASVVSCAERQIDLLGFITIPFGSLLAFAGIGFCVWMMRKTSPQA